jgi:hypothetical protein
LLSAHRQGEIARCLKLAPLRVPPVRAWFCVAIGIIAAAIADPIVEFASNAGWFGGGALTDRSNLDVVPAILAGVALLAIFMARKAPAILAGAILRDGVTRLLPVILLVQIGAVYAMETTEQLAVWGHLLGPSVWLGGPAPISLAIHTGVCIAVALAVTRSRRTLAVATLRIIRFIVTLLSIGERIAETIAGRRLESRCAKDFLPVPCTIGERAPPIILR